MSSCLPSGHCLLRYFSSLRDEANRNQEFQLCSTSCKRVEFKAELPVCRVPALQEPCEIWDATFAFHILRNKLCSAACPGSHSEASSGIARTRSMRPEAVERPTDLKTCVLGVSVFAYLGSSSITGCDTGTKVASEPRGTPCRWSLQTPCCSLTCE